MNVTYKRDRYHVMLDRRSDDHIVTKLIGRDGYERTVTVGYGTRTWEAVVRLALEAATPTAP